MKKVLILVAALALFATSAFASGCDLTFNTCPGTAGASTDATLDCAGGGTLLMVCTFQPNEALTDLVGIDAIVDLIISGGDVNSSANFWDFSNVNSGAYAVARARPSSGCATFTSAWGVGGSGEGQGAGIKSPTSVRIVPSAYRPTDLAVAANQKIFGFQLTIDASQSVEGGGNATTGCPLPVVIALNQIRLGSSGGAAVSLLTAPAINSTPCDHINGDATLCQAVPTVRHTWGQLKSLYR